MYEWTDVLRMWQGKGALPPAEDGRGNPWGKPEDKSVGSGVNGQMTEM